VAPCSLDLRERVLDAGALVGGAVAAAATAPYYYGPYGPYYGPACRPVWNGYYWVRGCY